MARPFDEIKAAMAIVYDQEIEGIRDRRIQGPTMRCRGWPR